jgi:hypothetical protein
MRSPPRSRLRGAQPQALPHTLDTPAGEIQTDCVPAIRVEVSRHRKQNTARFHRLSRRSSHWCRCQIAAVVSLCRTLPRVGLRLESLMQNVLAEGTYLARTKATTVPSGTPETA